MAESEIAFYSPLKPAMHPVPSGDRLMARSLIECLTRAGYRTEIASQLRAFLKDPDDETGKNQLVKEAGLEIQRLAEIWRQRGAPSLWFCYHSYYKSPDLIGPELCELFDIPYVTAETSYSGRRNSGIWAAMQERVLASIDRAAVNICFTQRDMDGLRAASQSAKLQKMSPFIDCSEFGLPVKRSQPFRLITVAMMRSGDKMNSYKRLATSLASLVKLPWTLSIVGDGPLRQDVRELFDVFPDDKIIWHGQLDRSGIARLFAKSSLYVWPGCGEAYGLAYLEAQAAGLPVVAFDTAGVPEVVSHGNSGILTPEGDDHAYAQAISSLLTNKQRYIDLADNVRLYVRSNHSHEQAIRKLRSILQSCMDNPA